MSDSSDDPPRAARISPRLLAGVLALLVIAAGVSLLFARGPNRDRLPGGASTAPAQDGYEGTLALPARPAPAISLDNYLGQPVTLSAYRGKAAFVTFLYTNCPDVCPLIASNLRVALNMLGKRASDVQLIAVSVDPRGDTPMAVADFLRSHQLTGRMQYLIGSSAQLSRTWSAWSVGSSREAGAPDLVAHDALVYGISASGKLTTVYPAQFEPSEIVHDVPKLLAG
jgi:protein SCO1/2